MTSKRPVILLCWGYNRPGWIKHFEQLNDDFEFVYLFYMERSEERDVYTKNKKIYYRDYSSPEKLLKSHNFSKVVFMGLDGLQTIALNVQAKKMNIPTFYMRHGSATLSLDDYRNIHYKKRSLLKELFTKKLGSWLFTWKFLLSALGLKNIGQFLKLVKYQFQATHMHPSFALKKNKTWTRIPDYFIVFSEGDVTFHMDRDGGARTQYIILGNMEITYFVRYALQHGIRDDRYLLYIETPLSDITDNVFNIDILSREQYNQLLRRLSEEARANGMRFVVKLHPYSYNNDYYYQDDNLEYVKERDIEPLILNTSMVIGYNSSLLIPAAYFKPCAVIHVPSKSDSFQEKFYESGACSKLDFNAFVNGEQTLKDIPRIDNTNNTTFIDEYIGVNRDGQGLERLKSIFLTRT